jgi:hypothetical protein
LGDALPLQFSLTLSIFDDDAIGRGFVTGDRSELQLFRLSHICMRDSRVLPRDNSGSQKQREEF